MLCSLLFLGCYSRLALQLVRSAAGDSDSSTALGTNTGVKDREILGTKISTWKKVLPLGLMFFLILFNYTILRDSKDVLVVTAPGSGAEIIPFLKTWVNLPLAVGFMILYTQLSNVLSTNALFYTCLFPFIGFFASFAFILYVLLYLILIFIIFLAMPKIRYIVLKTIEGQGREIRVKQRYFMYIVKLSLFFFTRWLLLSHFFIQLLFLFVLFTPHHFPFFLSLSSNQVPNA